MKKIKLFEEFANESTEPTYKVAGRTVTLNKGEKEDGTDWTVTFPNGDEKPLSDVLALIKPFPKGIKESLDEATTSWAKMMKGVKKSETGPWSLVAIQDRKVVGQKNDIRVADMLPAHFEALRKEYPKAKIHIEDGTGMVVWNESVKIKGIEVGTVLNFKDGETWKVTKIIGNESNPRGYFAKPHDEKTKKANTSMEIEMTPEYLKKELAGINEAKVETMEPEDVAAKWKVGDKIKWSSPNGILKDVVMGIDGLYIKIKSGGSIPYQSIVESKSIDVMNALKDVREYNKGKKTPADFNKLVTSIIKNLGFNDTDDNFDRVADHLGNSMDDDDNIPEDKDLINELFGILESRTINEAKVLDRDEMMEYLETKYGFRRVRTTEEFDNSVGGIWVSGENGESLGGKRIYNYYGEGKAYEIGVLVRYEKAINKLGWYSEWYDAGTVMIWPI